MSTEPQPIHLTGVIADFVRAINSGDLDAAVATFAANAYVNDNRREIRGVDSIQRWVATEMTGDSVTVDVTEAIDNYGDTIVRGLYDGSYDKTNLPDELILTHYFSVRDGKIVSLIILFNQPSPF